MEIISKTKQIIENVELFFKVNVSLGKVFSSSKYSLSFKLLQICTASGDSTVKSVVPSTKVHLSQGFKYPVLEKRETISAKLHWDGTCASESPWMAAEFQDTLLLANWKGSVLEIIVESYHNRIKPTGYFKAAKTLSIISASKRHADNPSLGIVTTFLEPREIFYKDAD